MEEIILEVEDLSEEITLEIEDGKAISLYTPEELSDDLTPEQIAYLEGKLCIPCAPVSSFTVVELFESDNALTVDQVNGIIDYIGNEYLVEQKPSLITFVGSAFGNEVTPLITPTELVNNITPEQEAALIPEICPVFDRIYNYLHITGQISEYAGGDAVWIKNNVFNTVPSSGKLVTLTDFFTLAENNVFGNINRFTDVNGLQVYGDNYIIDHFTGLGWYKVKLGSAIWADAVAAALSSTQNGHEDWFLPNILQTQSLLNIGNEFWAPLNYDGGARWSSTSTSTSDAIWFQGQSFPGRRFAKSTSVFYYICRKHF